MKTIIGAIIAIVIIILIVVFVRGSKQPAAPAADTTTTTQTQVSQDSQQQPVVQNDTTATPPATTSLQITDTKVGTGAAAVKGDTVTVNYTGMLTNGTVFDSNVDPKFNHVQPFSFTLGQNTVIAGWEQGVLGMKKGGKRHLVIPASLGYGAQGAGAAIPPNATLEFDVEMVSIAHQ